MTAARSIYEHLREGIAAGRYRPKDRLVEVDLAEYFAISRTPVRQALQLLESEGIVDSTKHGWLVKDFSRDDIRRIYDIRLALEGYASFLSAERATDAAKKAMREWHSKATVDLALSDRPAFVTAHNGLHHAIATGAENSILADQVQQHRNHHFNRRVASLYRREDLEKAVAGHEAIIAAIELGDGAKAEALTRKHLTDALWFTIELYS